MKSIYVALVFVFSIAVITPACSPSVGSEKWCAQMKTKDKGNWTAKEAAAYAENCIL